MVRWAQPEVISAAINGDAVAAEELIRRIWPACFRLAAALLGDAVLAQDAAQEACIIVHSKVATLRRPEAFDAWLYRIVVRESGRMGRRHKAVDRIMPAPRFSGEANAAIDVWRALAELPPPLRDVTVLFYFDDLKSDEIARVLRVPHPTVRSRLMRARERLRGLLHDYEAQPRSGAARIENHAL